VRFSESRGQYLHDHRVPPNLPVIDFCSITWIRPPARSPHLAPGPPPAGRGRGTSPGAGPYPWPPRDGRGIGPREQGGSSRVRLPFSSSPSATRRRASRMVVCQLSPRRVGLIGPLQQRAGQPAQLTPHGLAFRLAQVLHLSARCSTSSAAQSLATAPRPGPAPRRRNRSHRSGWSCVILRHQVIGARLAANRSPWSPGYGRRWSCAINRMGLGMPRGGVADRLVAHRGPKGVHQGTQIGRSCHTSSGGGRRAALRRFRVSWHEQAGVAAPFRDRGSGASLDLDQSSSGMPVCWPVAGSR